VAELPRGDEVYAGEVTSVNLETLECSVGGRPARFIHVPDRPKPWERSGWSRRGSDVYLRLMRRLFFSEDVPIRLQPRQVPLWLRPGATGRASLSTLVGVTKAAVPLAEYIPDGATERLRRMRRKIA
jgi:hypothetical protein